MSLKDFAEALPGYAKDIRLNLGSLLGDQTLGDQRKYGLLLACAHPVEKPNVVLVSMDTARFDRTSLGGGRDTTPNLAGLYASEVAVPDYGSFAVPSEVPTLAGVLRTYGYHTAAFTGGTLSGANFSAASWPPFSCSGRVTATVRGVCASCVASGSGAGFVSAPGFVIADLVASAFFASVLSLDLFSCPVAICAISRAAATTQIESCGSGRVSFVTTKNTGSR